MRVAVLGAGAVGAFIGAELDHNGIETVLVARGEHLRAMQETGLKVLSDDGERRQAVRAVSHIAEVRDADLVLVVAKAYDLPEIAASLAQTIPARTLVINLANGVGTPEILTATLGPERVLGGIAQMKCYLRAPGVIQHVGTSAGLQIGELRDAGVTDRVRHVAGQLTCGKLRGAACADIWAQLWQKAVFHVPIAGITTLLNQPFGPVRSDPGIRALLVDWMNEVAGVARSLGIVLPADSVTGGLAFIDSVVPDWRNSMQVDRERGKRLEADGVIGAVSRFARRTGAPSPITDAVYPFIKFYDRLAASPEGRRPEGTP